MRKILYIVATISLFVFANSCEYYSKQKSNFEMTKNAETTEAPSEETVTKIRHTKALEMLSQNELFENMVDAMILNDMDAYNKYIARFNNIDTLMFFAPVDEDEKYYSLLGMACKLNSLEAMKELIVKGADIKLGSRDEFSAYDALFYAISDGNAEMVKILVDKKTDVNILYSSTGITPLILCVMNKKYVMAETLLRAGAKVNGVGNMGDGYVLYPLHDAIRADDVEMVKLLLKYNADASLKDADGVNAVTLAKQLDAKDIVKILSNK